MSDIEVSFGASIEANLDKKPLNRFNVVKIEIKQILMYDLSKKQNLSSSEFEELRSEVKTKALQIFDQIKLVNPNFVEFKEVLEAKNSIAVLVDFKTHLLTFLEHKVSKSECTKSSELKFKCSKELGNFIFGFAAWTVKEIQNSSGLIKSVSIDIMPLIMTN